MMWVGLVGLWVTSLQTVPAGYAVYSAGVTRFFHTNLTDRRIRDRVYHLHCSRNLILTSEHIWRLYIYTEFLRSYQSMRTRGYEKLISQEDNSDILWQMKLQCLEVNKIIF
jgi:hypothetical protein